MSLNTRALSLTLLLVSAFPAAAEEASSSALREQAKAIRNRAENAFKVTSYHCYDKFLVNACLDEAKLTRLEQVKDARALEAQANKMDRNKRVRAMEARLRKIDGSAADTSGARR